MKTCRHCARGRASRPRGLCWACYDATDVRGLYARRGYGVADFCGPARVAGEPTPHAPGTPGKLAALEGRAARGEALFRRDDADHGGLR